MAGILRAPIQLKDKTNLQNGVTAAFEHAQHHHLHERQIQEKPVIHHAEEPGQGDQKHGVEYHHDNTESGSSLEKNGEIHVESLDRHVREDGEERDDFSGDGKCKAVILLLNKRLRANVNWKMDFSSSIISKALRP